MSLVFLVIVSAYALTGLVMDGAAAVRGKPLPSVLRREARQQARDYRHIGSTHQARASVPPRHGCCADAALTRHPYRKKARERSLGAHHV